jgi:hypothetical protein
MRARPDSLRNITFLLVALLLGLQQSRAGVIRDETGSIVIIQLR